MLWKPKEERVFAHSFAVEPVVKISSKMAIFFSFMFILEFRIKAFEIFVLRCSLLRVLWATIWFCLIKIFLLKEILKYFAISLAISSLWLYPLDLYLFLCNGTQVIKLYFFIKLRKLESVINRFEKVLYK